MKAPEGTFIVIFVLVIFFGGWILSSYYIRKSAKSLSKVFSRGFLIGAAEWLLMIPASMIVSANIANLSNSQSEAEMTGAIIGGGIITFLTGGVSIAMAIACLIGFAVSHSLGKEMKPEDIGNTKKCPQCAEMIKAEAKKCRFCGADLTDITAKSPD